VIIAHDAATGELDQSRDGVIDKVEDAYTITQSVGLVKQLDCGARAFDYRPYLLSDGQVIAHHGSKLIKKSLAASLNELQEYLLGKTELVVLYLSHFDGETKTCKSDPKENCEESREATLQVLKSFGIPFIQDCNELSGLTVQGAYAKGKLLAIINCVEEQYDPKITCYSLEYTCYGRNKEAAWSKFENYMKNATQPSTSTSLRMQQAHWQSSTESVPLGLAHGSSVLKDEKSSGVNKWLAEQINAGAFARGSLNLVELDNVCDYGSDVFAALNKLQ